VRIKCHSGTENTKKIYSEITLVEKNENEPNKFGDRIADTIAANYQKSSSTHCSVMVKNSCTPGLT